MGTVITIAREYGSGGKEIGMALASRLDIPYYDNELITLSVEKSGMSGEVLADADEKAANSLLYSLAVGSSSMGGLMPHNVPINDKLFILQSEVIRDLASRGDCIIVGRCGDYVLSSHEKCLRVFIYADFDDRVKRIAERMNLSESKARDLVIKTDKRRSNYYNYYTGQKWGRVENYDIAVSTSKLGIEGATELIAGFAKIFGAK